MGLTAVLEEARALGFLGPGPVHDHVHHAEGFAATLGAPPRRALDLGAGGGVPGLVLAHRWPGSTWHLLDSQTRRIAFLTRAIATLGLADSVVALHVRAEDAGRDPSLRGTFDVVTARSFGPPAVTAECAAPLLVVGGQLVVSEPPEDEDRWPAEGLTSLGLRVVRRVSSGPRFMVLGQETSCPDTYPRTVGRPAKRPLF